MDERVSQSKPSPATLTDRQRGIDRVIDVLEALLRLRQPTKVGDLARKIGAPRSTLYAIVNRLVEAEMLEPVGEDGYIYFGKAMHLYGRAYAEANPLHRRCRAVLDRLAAETSATAQLCALRGHKYVVVDSSDGSGLFRITTDIGVEVPLPWTASGRLLLDHMSAGEVRAFVPPDDYKLPDGRLLDPEEFVAGVAQARREGRCMTTSLSDRFTSCLAAPIRDRRGVAVATICLVVPADTAESRKSELLDRIVASGLDLSDRP
ncbi:IclR family transcriptional regulator [Labrys miyagiensis]